MRTHVEAIRSSAHRQEGETLAAEMRCVQYALKRLKVSYRAFIQLHFLENLPVEEVATILQVTPRTLTRWRTPAFLAFRKAYERCMET